MRTLDRPPDKRPHAGAQRLAANAPALARVDQVLEAAIGAGSSSTCSRKPVKPAQASSAASASSATRTNRPNAPRAPRRPGRPSSGNAGRASLCRVLHRGRCPRPTRRHLRARTTRGRWRQPLAVRRASRRKLFHRQRTGTAPVCQKRSLTPLCLFVAFCNLCAMQADGRAGGSSTRSSCSSRSSPGPAPGTTGRR